MKRVTIEEAVKTILKKNSSGLTPAEITEKILEQKLYAFNTDNPVAIVHRVIRKSCIGVELQISKEKRSFKIVDNGKYTLNNLKEN